jgi:hypothetical protein
MTNSLPRVTYSNIGVDFSPVHAHLDALIPGFEREVLDRNWSTLETIASPIDATISLGRFLTWTAADSLASPLRNRQIPNRGYRRGRGSCQHARPTTPWSCVQTTIMPAI